MKRTWKRVLASAIAIGIITASVFPGTVYATEVGEQASESTQSVVNAIEDNSDLIEQTVMDTITARGGDVTNQVLVNQVREEITKKVESGEMVISQQPEEDTKTSEESEQQNEVPITPEIVIEHESADEMLSDGNSADQKAATRLIVTSNAALVDYYGAVSVDHYDDIYVLTYASSDTLNAAYESFISAGIQVEKDYAIDAIKESETPEDQVKDTMTDAQLSDTLQDSSDMPVPTSETMQEHQTIVAVIDTGISDIDNDDVLKGRVIEGTSTISDSYVDDNGHGTAMAKIIAEDTEEENISILPIKALDENGKGTVLSVALAIKYAKEHGADVISLSLSGIGQSNVLTNAINDCYNNGITVVTAAGNDNADAMNYMPGNVDAALNIAAAEYDANGKIVAAGYTNHGDNVDFAALGTYVLSVTKDDTTIETELRGTSVAAAHVAAYVALIKQINSTVDGILMEISENDVLESLKASAQNVEGVSRTYFGYGFLTKDNLVFKSSTTGDDTKDSDLEEKEEDFTQNVHAAGYVGYIWGVNVWQAWDYNSFLADWAEIHIYYGGVGHIQLTGNVWKKDLWSVGNGVNISVDLNGYTMYADPNTYYAIALNEMFMIENGGTLKFYNGNIDGRGLCYWYDNGSDGVGALMSIWPGGTLILESCQIGNVTNLDDYNQENADKGGTIVNNYGTLTATNTNFHDCSGTAIWGAHPRNYIYGNGARTVLTNCSSNNVSGLWSDGSARGISASISVNGGTYRVGRNGHYLAGIEANNNSTLDIQNITLGGAVTVNGGSTATIRNCRILNNYVSSTDQVLWYAIGANTTKPIYVYDSTLKGGLLSGVYITGTAGGAANVISGCNIYENYLTGISKDANCIVNVINCNLYNNTTGIGSKNGGTVNLSKCNIYSNSTYGIENNGGTINFRTDYDFNSYCTYNPDVKNAFGSNASAIYDHWVKYGMNENRTASSTYSSAIYSNQYGIQNFGTVNVSGGTLYSNTYDGIRNAGTVNMSGGTIRTNQYGIRNGLKENGVIKNGTLNMSGGVISNSSLDGIYNMYGTATITGGTIKDNNRYGTNNQANMNYAGGSSGNNSSYDVYQNGNYKMSGAASTYTNGVYLAAGKTIEITGSLTCADGAIKVTIDQRSKDNYLGRKVAYCAYGMSKENADAMVSKFDLQNVFTSSGTNHKAALRSGTGTNGAIGTIVLSEEYYVTFNGNVSNEHLTFDLPQTQTIYWKEDQSVPTVGTIAYYDGREFKTLRNIGWSKQADGSGGMCAVGEAMAYTAAECTKDHVLYANYTTVADVTINGNTQTAGENYVIHGFVSNETPLPQNTFEKTYRGQCYDENMEREIPYKTVYSHHGWSYSNTAMYKDLDVGRCGMTFDLTGRILELLNSGQESVSEEGYINNIILYAVWDEPPKITAVNKYFQTESIKNGALNKPDLLRTASATDKEDGTDVTLEVEDFNIEDFLHLGEIGSMTVRYKATDGAGNVTYKLIKVVVAQSGIVQGEWYDENPAYVRLIDRENYEKTDPADGALMEDSVWYTIPTYRKTILDSFERIENDEAIIRYRFTCKDIRESQAYLREQMENGTYPTAENWSGWLEKFEHCKVFDTGYRSSEVLNSSRDPADYVDYVDPEE